MKRIVSFLLASLIATTLMAQTSNSFKWLRNVDEQTVRPYSEGLSAFFENGKWGFLNLDGKVAIKPEFDEVTDFEKGLSIVKKDGKYGAINTNGGHIFPITFDKLTKFNGGIALAEENGLKYYLYSNGKRQPLSNKYTFYPYSEGFARIKSTKNGKWGYIDSDGIIVINPTYTYASDFHGGFAIVSKGEEKFLITAKGSKKNTTFPVDTTLSLNSDGVGFFQDRTKKYVFVDKYLVPSKMTYVMKHDFSEGYALTKDLRGKLAFIDNTGAIRLDLSSYDDAGDFSEGKAWVMKNGKYGYINTRGSLVIDTIFTYASNFKDGQAYVASGSRQGIVKMAGKNEKFPQLAINNIRLVETNDNGKVDVDENFTIEMEVSNPGDDILNGAKITLGGDAEQSSWFSYESISTDLGNIPAGDSRLVTFTGKSNTELQTEDILLSLKGEASNLFTSVQTPFTFAAAGINACKPVIESYWAHNTDHTPIRPGKEATLMITVKNEGQDAAKDVTISLQWPDNIEFKESVLKIPFIKPSETKTISTLFTVKSDSLNANANTDFSVVAHIDEFTHKRKDVKYFSFASGKLNSQINLLTGAGAMVQMAMAQNNTQQKVVKESELVIGLNQVTMKSENRFALVIGNEDYNGGKRDASYQPNVEFAEQDATTFARFAEDMMGVPSQNIILLKNATYAQMKQNLSKIERVAKQNPGQVELIVYYAGHGQVDGDSKESYLIPVDVSITAPTAGIKLEEFYSTLSSCNAKRTIVFLDACYSGVGRGIIIRAKETPVKGNLVVMTATSSSQRSMPYHDKSHGLFTYFLLKTMKDHNGDISIGDLYNEVSATVKTKSIWINNMEQTPELINGPDIASGWKEWKF
ncbi:MAG: WG repeat-containing protein [Bacteroidales bacterium]|nr:WG repeat-containing protein [Bacteroidales bacterium]